MRFRFLSGCVSATSAGAGTPVSMSGQRREAICADRIDPLADFSQVSDCSSKAAWLQGLWDDDGMTVPPYSRPLGLPGFEKPPVVEVSVGIQFTSVPVLRAFEVAGLRERWLDSFPTVEEHPPLPPAIEQSPAGMPDLQVFVGPSPSRLIFIGSDNATVVQLQPDRIQTNWREIDPDAFGYPRWDAVRGLFINTVNDVTDFIAGRSMPQPTINQVEVTYINAIEVPGRTSGISDALEGIVLPKTGYLAAPSESRANFVFELDGFGQGPVRLYVEAGPGLRGGGRPTYFLNLTVRGAPADGDLGAAVLFADQAHDYIVRGFTELTPLRMQQIWGRVD